MIKKRTDIIKCDDGDILAEDIINDLGGIIAAEFTVVNRDIKIKLFEMGVRDINIYKKNKKQQKDEEFKDRYWKDIGKVKEIFYELSCGKMLDMNKVNAISNSIFEQIKKTPYIMENLYKLQNKDEYVYRHSVNVAYYAMILGKWLNLTENQIKEVIQVGILHDIGKIKIPLKILNKKGKLLSEEYDFIKQHTIFGYDMANKINDLSEEIKQGILMHHERKNGTGYPKGIEGNQIHLYAKICSVVDVYDALISDRAYKKKITPFDAFETLKSMAYECFDTEIIITFLENIYNYYIGATVLTNTGDIGEVVHISSRSISRPIIKINSMYYDTSVCKNLKICNII